MKNKKENIEEAVEVSEVVEEVIEQKVEPTPEVVSEVIVADEPIVEPTPVVEPTPEPIVEAINLTNSLSTQPTPVAKKNCVCTACKQGMQAVGILRMPQ